MRRQWRLGAAVILALAVLLSACGRETAMSLPSATPFPSPRGLRIAVASDLHFDPDNTDKDSGLGQTAYNPELLDALLWDAQRQGAQILLLTGDLVNGGRPHRHEQLSAKLRAAEETGLSVCVLPGNHDLAPVGQTDFAAFYAGLGYDEALSRDPGSLSYCVVRDGLMLLMMDTAGYGAGAVDLPGAKAQEGAGACFTEDTLRWAQAMLQEAGRQGLHVLSAGHYNLLPEISRQPDMDGYYLENGTAFADLLRSFHVPLYLSGHQHIRAVYQENGLTELLTEYLLAYPTGYTILDVTEKEIRCLPRRIDVDAWAAETGQTDPILLDFAAWQQGNLRQYAEENVRYMARKNPLTKRELQNATDFFYAVMDAFWRGELYMRRAELEAMRGYDAFFHCAEGFAYGWWLKDLIENASPLQRGFTLHWPD